jgi:hypothetical protein
VTGEVVAVQLGAAEARALTDEVKIDAAALWTKLLRLYEGGAHLALDYSSWGSYFEAEFGGSRSRAYELLNAGRVLDSVRHAGLAPPANARQAAELAPLLDDPELLRDAWTEATTNGHPTAASVRDAVTRRLRPLVHEPTEEERQRATALHVALAIADAVRYLDRPTHDAAKVAAMFDSVATAGIGGEDWSDERFRRALAFLDALRNARGGDQ